MQNRYLIQSFGDNAENTKKGVGTLIQLCDSNSVNGLILVPMKKNFKSSILNQVFSKEQLNILDKNGALKTPKGNSIELCSMNTYKNHNKNPIVLGLWASKNIIEMVENEMYCNTIIVVPWIESDTTEWIKNTKPTVI